MTVEVRGKDYELEWFSSNNLVAWVDLADATPGTNDYTVTFEIVKNVGSQVFQTVGVMSGNYMVSVKLTETPAA